MAHTFEHPSSRHSIATQKVHSVAPARILVWLRRGYHDMKRQPGTSLGYGALVTAFGLGLLVMAWEAPYLVPALIGGFMLVAPFAAIILYAISRQIEAGEPVDAVAAGLAWRRNTGSIALFGLMLTLSLILWERLAAIIFALFYGGTVPDPVNPVMDVLFSGRYTALLIVYFGVGALLATVVYSLSVVTAPMLLDQPVDVVTAALTSLRCCGRNPDTVALWALVIVALTAIGFATFMLGLIFLFPLLGHASWHAYRDMVEWAPER